MCSVLCGLGEDNLLIDVSVLVSCWVSQALAELVQSLGDGLFLGSCAEAISLSLLRVAVDTLVVSEKLWQVFGLSVGDGPFVLRWVKGDLLLLTFLLTFGGSGLGLSLLFTFAGCWLGVLFFLRVFGEFFLAVSDELGCLLFELQRDDGEDFADSLLNGEELIHES